MVDVLAEEVRRSGTPTCPAAALALAIPFLTIGFVWAPRRCSAQLAFLAVPTFLNIYYLAPALALVQNSMNANQRTMAGAMLLLVLNLIGLGGGPTFIGVMSDHFNADLLSAAGLTVEACKAAVGRPQGHLRNRLGEQGLQHALYWLIPFYVARGDRCF